MPTMKSFAIFKKNTGRIINPDETDIDRYILWEQQDRREIYEDNPKNIPLTDIIGSESRYDIEHTIPRSVSWDNSMANKTLCTKRLTGKLNATRFHRRFQTMIIFWTGWLAGKREFWT